MALKIEAGKTYRDRCGRKRGPMVEKCRDRDPQSGVCVFADHERYTFSGEDGTCYGVPERDLVAEWEEPKVESKKMTLQQCFEAAGSKFPFTVRWDGDGRVGGWQYRPPMDITFVRLEGEYFIPRESAGRDHTGDGHRRTGWGDFSKYELISPPVATTTESELVRVANEGEAAYRKLREEYPSAVELRDVSFCGDEEEPWALAQECRRMVTEYRVKPRRIFPPLQVGSWTAVMLDAESDNPTLKVGCKQFDAKLLRDLLKYASVDGGSVRAGRLEADATRSGVVYDGHLLEDVSAEEILEKLLPTRAAQASFHAALQRAGWKAVRVAGKWQVIPERPSAR
jgi:hypothetical protein